MTGAVTTPKKRGPAPGFKRAKAAPAIVPAANLAQPEAAPAPPVVPEPRNPLQSRRHIESMDEAELRSYAIQIGVAKRDAEGLSVERLRAACKLTLFDLIDSL